MYTIIIIMIIITCFLTTSTKNPSFQYAWKTNNWLPTAHLCSCIHSMWLLSYDYTCSTTVYTGNGTNIANSVISYIWWWHFDYYTTVFIRAYTTEEKDGSSKLLLSLQYYLPTMLQLCCLWPAVDIHSCHNKQHLLWTTPVVYENGIFWIMHACTYSSKYM